LEIFVARLRTLAVLVVLLGGLAAGAYLLRPEPARPNLLVIGIDTLRADRLGCYGYPRPTSPNIDALAKDAVLFEQAISQAPWTLPAFASMFTGLLPSTHGAGRGKGWTCDRMRPGHDTLAVLLRQAGWRTASYVTNGWVSSGAGMTEGIDPADTYAWLESDKTQAAAMKWIREHRDERFFMFLHAVDPHAPYEPSEKDRTAVGVRVDEATIRRIADTTANKRPLAELSPSDRAAVSDLYDAEVHQVDRRLGELFAMLKELDLFDRTIIVVVSDHGEELLDHGRLGHGHTLFDELLHVPLIVRFPGGRWAGRVPAQVRTMDLFPTLLQALDLPVPDGLDAQSLLPVVRNEPEAPLPAVAPAEFLWEGHEVKAVRRPTAKVLLTPATGELRWYDLAKDPKERAPLRGVGGAGAALQEDIEHSFGARLDGMLLSAFGDVTVRRVRLLLRTRSRFDEAVIVGGESGDRLRRSADGRRIKAWLTLDPSYDLADWTDIDSVQVRTADNAPVSVSGMLDDQPLTRSMVRLGLGRGRPKGNPPWLLQPDAQRLVVPVGHRPTRDVNVFLVVTSQGLQRTKQAPLPEETQKSLRALGYIE
jgi:arylsulfatase A-like enzyme